VTPREQLIRERATGIGGTDAAAICGLVPWRTPLQVWREKRRFIEGGEDAIREELERPTPLRLLVGQQLEPLIRQMYEQQTERTTFPGQCVHHPSIDFFLAHPDLSSESLSRAGDSRIVECKSVAGGWSEDEVPEHVLAQLQWNIGIARTAYPGSNFDGSVAWITSWNTFRTIDVDFDAALFDRMQADCAVFWTHRVLAKDPPAATAGDRRDLAHGFAPGQAKILPDEALGIDESLVVAKVEARRMARDVEELEARLLQLMDGAQTGVLPGGGVTYTLSSRGLRRKVNRDMERSWTAGEGV
jgi:predicted phage-related endonuclease